MPTDGITASSTSDRLMPAPDPSIRLCDELPEGTGTLVSRDGAGGVLSAERRRQKTTVLGSGAGDHLLGHPVLSREALLREAARNPTPFSEFMHVSWGDFDLWVP